MKHRMYVFALVIGTWAALSGCAAETQPQDVMVDSAEDLAAFSGTTVVVPTDAALRIELALLNGTQSHTINQRFVRALARRGGQTATLFCTASIHRSAVDAAGLRQVDCVDSVRTVSGDDDESLRVSFIELEANQFSYQGSYHGDGTFLGTKADVFLGPPPERRDAARLTIRNNSNRDPFSMLAAIRAGADTLIGRRLNDAEPFAQLPINGYDIYVSNALLLSGWVSRSTEQLRAPTRALADDVSALSTPGLLSSGLASERVLGSRLRAAVAVRATR